MSNPYHQPSAGPKLSKRETRLQRSVLEAYRKYRDRDMPLMDVVGFYAKTWLILVVILLPPAAFWIGFSRDQPVFAMFAVFILGTLVGRIGRDFAHCRVQTKLWPIIRDVLDWDRVDSKLDQLS